MDYDQIKMAPKVVLHDHLDGGLRPSTVAELADKGNYHTLPSRDAGTLAQWFAGHGTAESLEDYLDSFTHTVALMQTRGALVRVAREAVEDLAFDHVVYAEIRFAPSLLTSGGLTLTEVVDAVCEGFTQGETRAARAGHTIQVKAILTAMRDTPGWEETARLIPQYLPRVAGFDIAGPERGYPASHGLDTFRWLRTHNLHYTIHAGEGCGLPAIADAVGVCNAERLGHGVRLADDIITRPDGTLRLGALSTYIRDRRVGLEICPTSNLGTGVISHMNDHPFDVLYRSGIRVCVNTDNRLMSATSMTNEIALLVTTFGYNITDVARWTLNAAKASFSSYPDRARLIRECLTPQYRAIGARI